MAPTPLQYSVEDCDYETPAEGSIQQRIDLLSLHTSAVHGVQQQHVCQPSSRLDKLPRPVFTLNMTEAAWDYKVFEWESYIQQWVMSLQQRGLWLNTVTLLLARMKEQSTRVFTSLTSTRWSSSMKHSVCPGSTLQQRIPQSWSLTTCRARPPPFSLHCSPVAKVSQVWYTMHLWLKIIVY